MSALRRIAAVLGSVVLAIVVVVAGAPAASAHPLGNFTTNTAVALRLTPERIDVDVSIDQAEIPTVRAVSAIDADDDGRSSVDELAAYATTTCRSVADRVDLSVGGRPVDLSPGRSRASLVDGAAGLQTLRIDCASSAPVDLTAGGVVAVRNRWVGDRIGWHEVTAVSDGLSIGRGAPPTTSPSDGLRRYPEDRLAAPPDVRRATFDTSPGGSTGGVDSAADRHVAAGSVSALPGVDRASESFTDLVSREQLTFGVALVGLLLAILLGSLHALAPGHGKTVMAAYLLGGEGTGRQALALCATVTVTHTAGVLVLGTTLTVTTAVAPERLYPILGAISGLLVASIGVTMLRRARRFRLAEALAPVRTVPSPRRAPQRQLVGAGVGARAGALRVGVGPRPMRVHREHDHEHDHDAAHSHLHGAEHSHSHGAEHSHSHGAYSHSHPDPTEPVSWRSLVGMGFAGGMVPSPSALLVLLGAIALGRTWFGVALVIAYGAGMALSLVAAGLLLLRIRNRLDRYLRTRRGAAMWRRLAVMPMLTASFVVVGGVYLAVRAGLQY